MSSSADNADTGQFATRCNQQGCDEFLNEIEGVPKAGDFEVPIGVHNCAAFQ